MVLVAHSVANYLRIETWIHILICIRERIEDPICGVFYKQLLTIDETEELNGFLSSKTANSWLDGTLHLRTGFRKFIDIDLTEERLNFILERLRVTSLIIFLTSGFAVTRDSIPMSLGEQTHIVTGFLIILCCYILPMNLTMVS